MKGKRLFINSLIILVAIFFAYKTLSYLRIQVDEKKSMEAYSGLETQAFSKGPGSQDGGLDLTRLQAVNPDIFAWIRSRDGSIDYPLVRGGDNDRYLHTGANGERNALGAIFMDYRNGSLEDPFILIYGHMMKNDLMFGSLKSFKTQPRSLEFYLDTGEKTIKTRAVLAGILSGQTILDPRDFSTYEKRLDFYRGLQKEAVYDPGYDLQPQDQIINLVTCTYERANVRLFVLTVVEKA